MSQAVATPVSAEAVSVEDAVDLPVEAESSTAAVSFTLLAYIAMPELSCERLIYL